LILLTIVCACSNTEKYSNYYINKDIIIELENKCKEENGIVVTSLFEKSWNNTAKTNSENWIKQTKSVFFIIDAHYENNDYMLEVCVK